MKKYDITPPFNILRHFKIYKYTRRIRNIGNFILTIALLITRPSLRFINKRITLKEKDKKKIIIRLHRLRKDNQKSPVLLYMAGGGFQMRATPIHRAMLRKLIKGTHLKVVTVNYSLAPKYPYPTALNECYKALEFIVSNSDKYNFDLDHIYVGGDSAGGNLAASLAIMARDKNEIKIKKQLLIYPVIDKLQQTESMRLFTDTPMWNSINNKQMWEIYLNNKDSDLKYASPNLCDLSNLPEAHIETAEFDCLRDEAINYANQLKQANVKTNLIETKGTVHGYDALLNSKIVKNLIKERINFLNND